MQTGRKWMRTAKMNSWIEAAVSLYVSVFYIIVFPENAVFILIFSLSTRIFLLLWIVFVCIIFSRSFNLCNPKTGTQKNIPTPSWESFLFFNVSIDFSDDTSSVFRFEWKKPCLCVFQLQLCPVLPSPLSINNVYCPVTHANFLSLSNHFFGHVYVHTVKIYVV